MERIKPIQSGHSLFLKSKIEATKIARLLNKTPGQVKVGVRKTKHLLRGKGYLVYSGNY